MNAILIYYVVWGKKLNSAYCFFRLIWGVNSLIIVSIGCLEVGARILIGGGIWRDLILLVNQGRHQDGGSGGYSGGTVRVTDELLTSLGLVIFLLRLTTRARLTG